MIARQRACADSTSLNTIARAAAGLPAPRVTFVRSLTVENVDSTRRNPVSYMPTATAASATAAPGQHFCLPDSPRGLLEPVAWKSGTAGSEGAQRGNALGLPDELFFSTLTRRLLRRGQFASRDELAAAIDTFVLAYDEHDAKPYRWTYDGSPLKAA